MDQLVQELALLDLPSTMWAIHVHPKHEFIAILHIKISTTNLIVDKGLLLVKEVDGIKARIFLNGFITFFPSFELDVKLISDISNLLYSLHHNNLCLNSTDGARYPKCLKLISGNLYSNVDDSGRYCDICSMEYRSLNIEETPISVETCSVYNKDFPSETDLIVHKKQHKEPPKNRERPRKFQKEDIKDREKVSNENRGLCNICGKVFAYRCRIKEHMLTHTQEKPFQCNICHKAFPRSYSLKVHQLTHSGDRPYVCSRCGKTHTTSSNLKAHMIRSHGEEKKHVCEICKMTFIYPRYLKLHLMKHTGEKPFICSVCGKKFLQKEYLGVHMRIHSGEKPHCCNFCGRGFTTLGALNYHQRAHHNDSNF